MSGLAHLKAEIENLPPKDFTELCQWLRERDWEKWDSQIEADSQRGYLDFLVEEALAEKEKGTLKDL